MMAWAVTFLVIGLAAGALGISGMTGNALHAAWILFAIGLALAVALFGLGRRSPPA